MKIFHAPGLPVRFHSDKATLYALHTCALNQRGGWRTVVILCWNTASRSRPSAKRHAAAGMLTRNSSERS